MYTETHMVQKIVCQSERAHKTRLAMKSEGKRSGTIKYLLQRQLDIDKRRLKLLCLAFTIQYNRQNRLKTLLEPQQDADTADNLAQFETLLWNVRSACLISFMMAQSRDPWNDFMWK
ncbi:unnamed protein product [Clonostachys rosea]|uniref:Uncharacterized protein n=1 Tax=Bionectria ochroleuca TaxID=29856 RepID=A0ABY6UGE3_BIOOC|nr:unnamed protein product [Clonostachys rosea]